MGRSYRDLVAWQKGIEFVMRIYQCTEIFPKAEQFGLISQLRRAAVSIPSNIAEGQARRSSSEFRQALGMARGSLMEVETQLIIAAKLGYIPDDELQILLQLAAELGRIINGLKSSLK